MNKPKSLKAIVLSMALTAGMLSSANATAQEADRPGGLFGGGSFFDEFVGLFADNDAKGGENETGFDISTGLFGGNGGDAGGNYGINIGTMGQNPPPPEETPLGSGLFIMAAAGAAYAFSKKRKNQENN